MSEMKLRRLGGEYEAMRKPQEERRRLYEAEMEYLARTGKGEEYLSVSEAKTLGVPYGATKAEAMKKGIVPKAIEKEWTEFTDVEKRKLTAARIDWTTPAGYKRAVDYLYPDKPKGLNIAIAGMTAQISKVLRADGYISPENWRIAKTAWANEGLDPEKFIRQFYIYINPAESKEYGAREAKYIKGELADTWKY